MVCREAASLLAEYCRGETSPTETRFVDSHLKRCVHCQDAERTERRLVGALRDYSCHLHAPPSLRDFAQRVPAG